MRHHVIAALAILATASPALAEPIRDKPMHADGPVARAPPAEQPLDADKPPMAQPPQALSADRVGRPVSDRIGQIIEEDQARHVAACQARYRTYNPKTDTYFARPGVQRRCRL